MDDQYFLQEDGEQTGPYTLDELIERAPDIHTRVLSTSENSWRDACDLPELYEYFRELDIYFPTEDNLASFGMRFGAFVIDMIFVWVIFVVVVCILAARGVIKIPTEATMDAVYKMPVKQTLTIQVTGLIILLLYNAICEASSMRGSVGKRVVGLIVVNADGEGIGPGHALARSLGKVVSLNFWGLGFISIFFTEHKQALHDLLAKTYVIRKNA